MRVIINGCWRKVFRGEIYEDVVPLCSSSPRSKILTFSLVHVFIRQLSLLACWLVPTMRVADTRSEMRRKCFCSDGGRRTTLAVLERSRPHIVAFEMTWKLKKKKKRRGILGLWLHIKPSPWCIHALLATSPRGVVCKWVPGSALSVWQHSECEGRTDTWSQAVRPSLASHPRGIAI